MDELFDLFNSKQTSDYTLYSDHVQLQASIPTSLKSFLLIACACELKLINQLSQDIPFY